MSIEGAGDKWAGVIEDQAPKLLKLVVAAWKRIAPGEPDEKEDDITNHLCLALQRCRTARKLMFLILPQVVELDPETSGEFGRMDIAFFPTNQPSAPREDVYFCLECKRLNVIKNGKRRRYCSEYVTLGMSRFVSGQYSRTVRHGAMIGYVRDGDVSGAMDQIAENVRGRHKDLAMDSPGNFLANGFLPRMASAKETHHKRPHGKQVFRLHHLFMAGASMTSSGSAVRVNSSL